MKNICILGSTGSIGVQTLDIIRDCPEDFQVIALSCGNNISLLEEQISEFHPKAVVISGYDSYRTEKHRTEKHVSELVKKLADKYKQTEFLIGKESLNSIVSMTECDLVVNGLVGIAGLAPTYYAIQAGKEIALANKETLVSGGELIARLAREKGVKILPVDSEHSAVFQCIKGNGLNEIKKIILTASGGPFRGYSLQDLEKVTVGEALKHPNWEMGNKITIDSSTLMNKGLEVIEAKWLFDMAPDDIDVIVHPQSVIHSMVEYVDHSVIAQLGLPDMRLPIAYALNYPKRKPNVSDTIDFTQMQSLTFEKPDMATFQCLQYAYDVLNMGGSYPIALNAANEVLVGLFLENKINFIDIQNNIYSVLESHNPVYHFDLDAILNIDKQVREGVLEKWYR